MEAVFKDILAQMWSSSERVSEDALLNLSLYFDWKRCHISEEDFAKICGKALLSAQIDDEGTKEIVREVVRFVDHQISIGKSVSSAMCVFHDIRPDLVLAAHLQIPQKHWQSMDVHARHNWCASLRDMLAYGDDDLPVPALYEMVTRNNPERFIEECKHSSDVSLPNLAKMLHFGFKRYMSGKDRGT